VISPAAESNKADCK